MVDAERENYASKIARQLRTVLVNSEVVRYVAR